MNRIRVACLFYAVMGCVGLALMFWRHGAAFTVDVVFRPPAQWLWPTVAVIAGIAATHHGSRWLAAHWKAVARSAWEIRRYLDGLTPRQILLLALFSGFGEELLFRGWLMPETGLLLSSAIFGVVHFPLNRDWIFWPFFAFGMGLVLGLLFQWSGHILWPILLHAGINHFNLRYFLRDSTQPGVAASKRFP